MKTTLVFELLVLFLYTVCAELVETSAVRSSSQSRRLQEVSEVFGEGFGEAGEANVRVCIPVPFIDIGYSREMDAGKVIPNTYGLPNCLGHCSQPDQNCVALNYNPNTHICTLITEKGEMVKTEESRAILLAFADNDPCNTENFLPGYYRPGHNYETKPGVATDTDCCKICLEASPHCASWGYNEVEKTCYLKDAVPLLKAYPAGKVVISGFGAYCFEAP